MDHGALPIETRIKLVTRGAWVILVFGSLMAALLWALGAERSQWALIAAMALIFSGILLGLGDRLKRRNRTEK